MRVALVTPVAYPAARGNAVTVERLARGLRNRGIEVDVLDLSRAGGPEVGEGLTRLAPDLIHAFHAFQATPAVVAWARARGIPLVVSLTGTDVNHDLFDPGRRAATARAIGEAQAVVVFHETIRAKAAGELPEAAALLEVIPQSVQLADEPYPLADLVPRRPGEVRFLLPAGIRRVKNVLVPFGPLGTLAGRHPIRFLIAGPVLEETEGAATAA
jgi:glycosyltransferase involved in cell wall biosynthesis